MYRPQHFNEPRTEVLQELIRQYSFGTLVSHVDGEMMASHLPFLLQGEGPQGTLLAHVARANPQWSAFRDGQQVLAIFHGPHAYVSPSWYETELSVPTWNYAVVHAYGVPRLIEEVGELRELLREMVGTFEDAFEQPWSLDRLPEEFLERQMRAIVGFEIPISRLEGKVKMSQNRLAVDRAGAARGLRQVGRPEAIQVAEWIERVNGE